MTEPLAQSAPLKWWQKKIWTWLRVGAEYIAIVILFSHFLPPSLIENWRENGVLAIFFLGICLLIVLIFNFIITMRFRKELENKQAELTDKELFFAKKEAELMIELKELNRKARYADVFPHLNKAFSSLHDAEREPINDASEQNFRAAFRDFCTTLAQVFQHLTGVKECHVCIKIPIKTGNNNRKPEKVKAKTLVRDAIVLNRDEVDGKVIDHILSKNTDFEYIFNNIQTEQGRYFFCNNLPAKTPYKNTSFLAFGTSITYFHDNASIEEREKDWPLKYRAAINAAVCPGITQQRNTGTLVGFLCVDSPNKDVFIEKFDAEIISGCADGLYNPLKKFLENYYTKKPIKQ